MSSFCSDCGKDINEGSSFCQACGSSTNGTVKRKQGKGIASLILGILGLLYALLVVLGTTSTDLDLSEMLLEYTTTGEVIAFGIGFILVQSILAITGLLLALSERKAFKSGINATGFYTSLLAIIVCVITFIMVLSAA